MMGDPVSDPKLATPISLVVVEDTMMLATVASEALASMPGLTVAATVHTCADGVAAVLRHTPDVVLLDQDLPDGLGTNSIPAMLDACPGVKVLVVTGLGGDDVLTRAQTAGAVGVVLKGQRLATLVQAIRAAANPQVAPL
jgi:DNA-binding NarL/FixJ family response regulator